VKYKINSDRNHAVTVIMTSFVFWALDLEGGQALKMHMCYSVTSSKLDLNTTLSVFKLTVFRIPQS